MKNLQKLTQEIYKITTIIEQDYPELYQYLEENPLTIPNEEEPGLGARSFEDYLNTLKELLAHHIETHSKGNS